QLVARYYGLKLPPGSRPHIGQILATIPRMLYPFTCREASEDALIRSGEDCCTPRAMGGLLGILATTPKKYAIAYSHMQRCAGGLQRIPKGLADYMGHI